MLWARLLAYALPRYKTATIPHWPKSYVHLCGNGRKELLGILAAKRFSGGRPSTLSERAEPFGTIFVSSVSGVASSYSNQSEADSENLFSGEGSGCRRG